MVQVFFNEGEFRRGKFSKDKILEVNLRRRFRADADAIADKAVAEVREEAGHAVVAAVAAGGRHFQAAELDGEVVVNGDDIGGYELVGAGQRGDGRTAFIHKRLRFHEEPGDAAGFFPTGDLGLELRVRVPGKAELLRKGVDDDEPEVVPGFFVLAARIAEAGDQSEGRLFKNCTGRRNGRFGPRARLELPGQCLEGLARQL